MYSVFENAVIVNISDFEIYDQIITFLLPSNRLISALALGTKKINSKNARRIAYLNQVEVEVFLARYENRLSKLKSVHLNQEFAFEYLKFHTFQTFIKYLSKEKELKKDFYTLFQQFFFQLKLNQFSDLKSEVDLLILIFQNLGLNFNFHSCILCHSHKICTISLKHSGMICYACNDKELLYPKWFLKNFYFLVHEPQKIQFQDLEQETFFYTHTIKILKRLIDTNAGVNLT